MANTKSRSTFWIARKSKTRIHRFRSLLTVMKNHDRQIAGNTLLPAKEKCLIIAILLSVNDQAIDKETSLCAEAGFE